MAAAASGSSTRQVLVRIKRKRHEPPLDALVVRRQLPHGFSSSGADAGAVPAAAHAASISSATDSSAIRPLKRKALRDVRKALDSLCVAGQSGPTEEKLQPGASKPIAPVGQPSSDQPSASAASAVPAAASVFRLVDTFSVQDAQKQQTLQRLWNRISQERRRKGAAREHKRGLSKDVVRANHLDQLRNRTASARYTQITQRRQTRQSVEPSLNALGGGSAKSSENATSGTDVIAGAFRLIDVEQQGVDQSGTQRATLALKKIEWAAEKERNRKELERLGKELVRQYRDSAVEPTNEDSKDDDDDEYVYDVYCVDEHMDPMDQQTTQDIADFTDVINFDSLSDIGDDGVVLESEAYRDSDFDSEDSNHEDHYQNDYPDEPEYSDDDVNAIARGMCYGGDLSDGSDEPFTHTRMSAHPDDDEFE